MLVFGDQEESNKSIKVRKRGKGDLGGRTLEQFINQINIEICEKSLL